ncbi:Heat shock 70 kDa protein 12A [Mactra antiquata]
MRTLTLWLTDKMATKGIPIVASAVKPKVNVAAIDFGTTYSGYALSFRSDFIKDPMKIVANQWHPGASRHTSLKTSSCILFRPDQTFDSFGFEAEDKYAELAIDEQHLDWFYFKRFKMLLYENKTLTRATMLNDDKGLQMPAMKVFSESIRYLKDHLYETCDHKNLGLRRDETHWVLTVPAIWDDTAKQFMREAAMEAGIDSNNLSLALEPEAASMFCKYLPVERVEGVSGQVISCFAPGKKYLVLDAGGGTVDITVHEIQRDGTIRELYKANGGPWGGTKVDETFLQFLADIVEPGVFEAFQKQHTDDYLDLMREFEVKKTSITTNLDQKVTIKIPLSLHDTYSHMKGREFRMSLSSNPGLKDKVTMAGDKLRLQPETIVSFFEGTCQKIVSHLNDIFSKRETQGTDTILMVGGFSESQLLQEAVKKAFPQKRTVIPIEAGLAVLKGAVIFGHNPTVIASRVAKYTYGIRCCQPYDPSKHPEEKMIIVDGKVFCDECFDKHVTEGQEVEKGMVFKEKRYIPLSRHQLSSNVHVVTSDRKNPKYTDEPGCKVLGEVVVDLSGIEHYRDRGYVVKMIYGNTELGVEARVEHTGQVLQASFDFLG